LGTGNVALDVARILARRPGDLDQTDAPDHVLAGLKASSVRDIHLFGRRGPAQAKFAPLELRELGQLPGIEIVVDPADFQVDQATDLVLAANPRRRQMYKVLQSFRDRPRTPGDRRVHLHFWSRPWSIEGPDAVTALTVRRTAPDGQGGAKDLGTQATHPVQAVYRAIGYFGSPLPGVPFDAAAGVVANVEGRVVDQGRPVPGLYTTGWIKRGPVGLIGSTKSDAAQTVAHLLADLPGLTRGGGGHQSLRAMLERQGLRHVSWEDWLAADAAELALGAALGRPRVKLAGREELLQAAGAASRN
jgi:ferredoxin--NADP+ reductase